MSQEYPPPQTIETTLSHESLRAFEALVEKCLPRNASQLLLLLDTARVVLLTGVVIRAFSQRRLLPESIRAWQCHLLLLGGLIYFALHILLRLSVRRTLVEELKKMGRTPSTEGFPSFKRLAEWNIALDSVLCSFFYIVTLNPESELFVFYFIPLTTALLFLSPVRAVWILLLTVLEIVICAGTTFSLAQLMPPVIPAQWTPGMLLLHVIAVRAFSFSIVLLPLASLVLLTRYLQHDLLTMKQAREDAMLRAGPECIFAKDRQGVFTFASDKFCDFVDRPRSLVLGHNDKDFFLPDDAISFVSDDQEIFSGTSKRIGPKEERNTLVLPNGQTVMRHVVVTKVPVYGANSDVVEVVGAFFDNSAQKRKQRDMFRFFTHDFPKPLDWIRTTYLPAIKTHCDGTRDLPSWSEAHDACQKTMVCCSFLLACGRAYGFLSGGYPEQWNNNTEFNLHEPLDLVLQIINPQNSDIRFFKQVSQKQRVRTDMEKITAIIHLLLSNSIKAIRGVIPCTPDRRRIHITIRATDNRLFLSVEDFGCGIAPDDVQEAFNLGFSKFSSTGFGLYIVRNFALLGEGKAWFEEGRPVGACCNIEVKCDIVKP